ncbi:MAG: aminoacyl-tRNA hydrolase [Rhodospirillales bacterium]|nr:aminoacyl-tRNA hydrolase [Rhodospirillales bacterium]
MIEINDQISIDPRELQETFMRASGPGGQNVNKTDSAVQLRFDARHSAALSNAVFLRLKPLAGRRMTRDGVIVISANRHRTQEANRRDAMDRLVALIREAAQPPKYRRPTKPSKGAKQRRLDGKRHLGIMKKGRGKVSRDD